MFEQASKGMYIFQSTKITLLNITYHSIYLLPHHFMT